MQTSDAPPSRYVLVPRPVKTDGLGASTRVGGALMTVPVDAGVPSNGR